MKKILALVASIMMLGTVAFALTGCSDNPFVKALQNASDKAESITASFDGIEIVSDTADLTFVASDESKIEYTTHKRIIYSTEVENGILKIKLEDNRRWFQKIFSFDDSSKLTVYLPAGEYSSLTIRQDTGDITVPADYKFGSADIDLSTGDTKLSVSVDGSLKIHSSTGSITLENVSCGTLDTKVSTGKTTLTNVADGIKADGTPDGFAISTSYAVNPSNIYFYDDVTKGDPDASLKINGYDLLRLKFTGKEIKDTLKKLKYEVILEKTQNNHSALLKRAEKIREERI